MVFVIQLMVGKDPIRGKNVPIEILDFHPGERIADYLGETV